MENEWKKSFTVRDKSFDKVQFSRCLTSFNSNADLEYDRLFHFGDVCGDDDERLQGMCV